MPNNSPFVASVNELLAKLEDNPTVDMGIELANQIVLLFGGVSTKSVEDVFESSLELPNAERYDSWFQPHPIFKSDRACFDLADSPLLQAKFYWLKKRSRQIIAGGVHFTPNYEDEEFTHNERYKVGLDFFLSPNGKALQVVLSNRGNLRIVELSGRLNNTQKEIFEKWIGAGSLKSQEALHTTLWESFKLKSVNQKFYDGVSNSFTELLQHLKSIDKEEEEAKLFASRLLGRLLFCWFLRKKGIIDESVGYFNAHDSDATNYYKQSLERLFFLTLNTPIDGRDELTKQHQKALFPDLLTDDQPSLFKTDQKTPYLNGGLFEPHENDWYNDNSLSLPEGFFTNLYDHFEEFNFTTDESSPEYEQIAIDPEMLGRVFESLLATQVDETGQQARKAKGAFYTPREIVSYMCKESLRNYLYNAVNNDEATKESIDSLLDITDSEWAKSKSNTLRDKVKDNRTQIIDALDAVTILDPACGSGAFPMGMLQLMLKTYERLESRFDPYKTKLSVIQNNIFGVDIEPMAVEISRLRAWLSLIVDEDDPRSVDPLPNLDFKFVCANSLVPLDKEIGLFSDSSLHQKLKDIRTKYFNARKKHTKKTLQDEYYKLTSSEQTSLITDDKRTKQLKSFDPFKNSSPAQFYDNDHMFGLEAFDVVIGNPPYISALAAKKIITAEVREKYKDLYVSARGAYDMYLLFFERGLQLLKTSGLLSYISPTKFVSAKYAESFRRHIGQGYVYKLADFSNTKVFESAGVSTLVTFLQYDQHRDTVVTDKYDSSRRDNVRVVLNSTQSLTEFPENIWGHLLTGNYSLLSKVYSQSSTLEKLAEVNGSSTANEGDRFSGYIVDSHIANSIPIVNTGNITSFNSLWGIKEYSNKRNKILKPYIVLDDIGERRVNMYKSQKIIISKLAKRLTAMIDENGEYASTNTTFVYSPKVQLDLIALTALLNSQLMNFVYKTAFSGLNLLGSFQFQAPQIRLLPVHKKLSSNNEVSERLNRLVKELMAKNLDQPEYSKIIQDIDQIIYDMYGIHDEEISIIEGIK